MAMNRRTRRHLQRQGEMAADGTPVPNRDRRPAAPSGPQSEGRAGPAQFIREVRSELSKVNWPSRSEVVNYSVVVFITIVVLTSIIAGLDFALGEAVLRLFDVT
ncbi:MAG TPA: preprotein translocase subunit SecE [Acidimicrobiaceae bacterium]|nr:preprotein translocase subunit SecE [Acidimicrobiaceae bacterium]HCB36977.1 preprotein translocase subunit SecE [Acidimicrobiaceae bacterium]